MKRATRAIIRKISAMGIFFFCFGYFAAYVPYTMWVKLITRGLFEGMDGNGFDGFVIQPVVVFGNCIAVFATLTLLGWWRFARQFKIGPLSLPRPRWLTFLSGLCTAGIIITTTLAYTFNGISIVFAMLLMRGGVLALGPLIDTIAVKRKRIIHWTSWLASLLSFAALMLAFTGKTSTAMTTVATIDISLYLVSYFIRLFLMSNYAKSHDDDERRGYIAEEQLVANTVLFGSLVICGLLGKYSDPGSLLGKLHEGIAVFPYQGYFWQAVMIGVFSYGTGIFGALILLDKRENTFTIPANRSSSVLAGLLATYLLAQNYHQKPINQEELLGVFLILAAIFFLSFRTVAEKKRKKLAEKLAYAGGYEKGS